MLNSSPQETAGFDWDSDVDDLLNDGSTAQDTEYSYEPPAPVAPVAAPRGTGLRVMLAKWTAPALVVVALAGGVAFPEKFGFGKSEVQTAALFVPFTTDAPVVNTVTAAPDVVLLVYTDTQSRNFRTGLRRFSDADLLAYAQVTQVDLERAGPMMRPRMQDALSLITAEAQRRNLTIAPVLRSVEDVQIQLPLRG